MSTLVPIRLADGTSIYVESAASALTPEQSVIREAGAADAGAKALDTGAQLSESIKSFCSVIVKSLSELTKQPAKISLEFGLSISLEGNVYVVKTSGDASIKITAEWRGEAPPRLP